METGPDTWIDVRQFLRAARDEVAPQLGTLAATPNASGPLTGSLDEFEEFLDHNELELAFDALAALADRVGASAGCWRKLAQAAALMQLPVKQHAALRQALPDNSK